MATSKLIRARWLPVLAAGMLMLPMFVIGPTSSMAQGGDRKFPETGKTVKGAFLDYWNRNGGLAQQGYPISDEMQEISDTDGKTYTVQYFERAVFEMHPELPSGKNVLLSLLGNFLYKQKYPNGAPSQQANTSGGSMVFRETGKRLGGIFLDYWRKNGALPQQGFPISDEFMERSDLDGKTYRVQYFERAVFEYHPENKPPYDVLLSQLGTFRYKAKYASGNTGGNTGGQPQNKDASVQPSCGVAGTTFRVTAWNFTPDEALSLWFTAPDGNTVGTANPSFRVPGEGGFYFDVKTDLNWAPGRWAITFKGDYSKHESIAWFQIVANASQCSSTGGNPTPVPPAPTTPPQSGGCNTTGTVNGRAEPTSVKPNNTVRIYAWGFTPNEALSLWFTAPDGSTVGTANPSFRVPGEGGFYYDVRVDLNWAPGRWAITFQGDYSKHKSVVYFCVTP